MSMPDPTYRVVFHLDEAERAKHEAILRNIRNLLDDLGAEQTRVELVAHGPGIDLLTGQTGLGEQAQALAARGVILAACHNTLRERQIPAERLLPGVTVVPAGIGEIVRREAEGWLYVRP